MIVLCLHFFSFDAVNSSPGPSSSEDVQASASKPPPPALFFFLGCLVVLLVLLALLFYFRKVLRPAELRKLVARTRKRQGYIIRLIMSYICE